MQKRWLILGAVAIIALPVAWYLVSPLFLTKRVDESVSDLFEQAGVEMTEVSSEQSSQQGSFEGLAGHAAEGRVSLLNINGTQYLRLEDDFRVTNGPDLYVGFGKNGEYVNGSELARLKGNEGGQNYEVPSGVDVSQYDEVWIWCRAFFVPFAKAVLQ